MTLEKQRTNVLKRRRWLLGLEPIFEGGWLHKDSRASRWDAEDELIALSLLGDVTVDLTSARSVPSRLDVNAYAILRDVDVFVAQGTRVRLTGHVHDHHVSMKVPEVAEDSPAPVVWVHAHTFLGDVTVRARNGSF
jgi:hypothetical protein